MSKLKAAADKLDKLFEAATKPNPKMLEVSEGLSALSKTFDEFANNIYPTPAAPQCPRCGSKNFEAYGKKFSAGKALIGTAAIGPIGVLAGTSRKAEVICKDCGKRWTL